MGAAEIAHQVFLGVPAFLVTQEDDLLRANHGKATDQGVVIAKGTVAAQLDDFGSAQAEIVEEIGTLGVADDLDPLSGAEFSVNITASLLEFFLQGGDFGTGLDLLFASEFAQLIEPLLEFNEGLFKLQRGDGFGLGHKVKSYPR